MVGIVILCLNVLSIVRDCGTSRLGTVTKLKVRRTSVKGLLPACMSSLFLPQLSATIKREEIKNRERNSDKKEEKCNDRKDDKIRNTRKYGQA